MAKHYTEEQLHRHSLEITKIELLENILEELKKQRPKPAQPLTRRIRKATAGIITFAKRRTRE